MTDWQPFHRTASQNGQAPGVVRIGPNGQLTISADVAAPFRPHRRVQPLKNGNPSLIGLRGVSEPLPGHTLGLGGASRVTVTVSFSGTLAASRKQPPRKAVELPHHWDGDVLVIDVSGLPDATGGR